MEPTTPIALEATGAMRMRPTGVAVYGQGLIRALAERSPGRYELVHPWSRWGRRRVLRAELPGLPVRGYWTGRGLSTRFSLLHALDTRLPPRYVGALVITLFDVLSALEVSARLGFAASSFREKKLAAYRRIAARADAIVTLSSVVRDEVQRLFEPRAAVHVVPPGLDAPEDLSMEEALRLLAPHGITPPFVLSVGALCPRKNVEAAVAAFLGARDTRSELKLVLVGEPAFGWHGSAGERSVAQARGSVCLAGYLPRRALWAAYRTAEALVHLSHYEGYGLTVLEALSVGAPVLSSDRGGIPEAAGGGAWLVDPDDAVGAARLLRRILESPEDREARRLKGLEHSRRLTWATAAGRMEQVYHEVLKS